MEVNFLNLKNISEINLMLAVEGHGLVWKRADDLDFVQVLPFLYQLCDLELVAYSFYILVFSLISLDKNAANKYIEKCFLIY